MAPIYASIHPLIHQFTHRDKMLALTLLHGYNDFFVSCVSYQCFYSKYQSDIVHMS